jgi:hypothetical protein
MRGTWVKKGLVVLVFLLFIATGIIPSSGQEGNEKPSLPTSAGKTIYVDDNNINGPWDGTLSHPFRTIQDGLNNSQNGDTVYVFKGVYDHAYVYHTVNLIGEDKENTVILHDSGIESEKVNISGFTLKGRDDALYVGSEQCVISDNIIEGYYFGIDAVHNCTIKNNKIKNNGDGIRSYGHNNISNNIFINNTDGIWFDTGGGDSVCYNNFSKNKDHALIMYTSSNMIYRNNFILNKNGIIIVDGINNTISENNFIFNVINAGFSTIISLPLLSQLQVKHKNVFDNNYWSRYKQFGSKLIYGNIVLLFYIPLGHYFLPIPIPLPWINFDRHPAKKPFHILGMI